MKITNFSAFNFCHNLKNRVILLIFQHKILQLQFVNSKMFKGWEGHIPSPNPSHSAELTALWALIQNPSPQSRRQVSATGKRSLSFPPPRFNSTISGLVKSSLSLQSHLLYYIAIIANSGVY